MVINILYHRTTIQENIIMHDAWNKKRIGVKLPETGVIEDAEYEVIKSELNSRKYKRKRKLEKLNAIAIK